jgi:RNA polymerase sigma-70 factor (ECF subfamily)
VDSTAPYNLASARRRDGANAMTAEPTDDASLLRRIGAGDRQALAELYARYRQPLYHYLLRLAGDAGLAEDLLQETLVAVWRSAGSFAGRSSPRTWLIGVARRQAHNTLRRRSLPMADSAELAVLEARDPAPEDAALANAEREELLAAIARLSLIHREALALAFGAELSTREIAEILGIPQGTVKSRLRDAKHALRTLLDPGKDRS